MRLLMRSATIAASCSRSAVDYSESSSQLGVGALTTGIGLIAPRGFAGHVRQASVDSGLWLRGHQTAAAPVEVVSAVVRRRAAIDGVADCAAATALLSSPAPSAHRCAAAGLDSSTAAERLASMSSTAQWIA